MKKLTKTQRKRLKLEKDLKARELIEVSYLLRSVQNRYTQVLGELRQLEAEYGVESEE